MGRVFIAKGNGYAGDKSFDGYTILAAPLPGYDAAGRESRVFGRGKRQNAVDYGSHILRLATPTGSTRYGAPCEHDLYLLVQHGGGTEVLAVPSFYDGGDLEKHIIAMPERLQYALLYTLYQIASSADRTAREEVEDDYKRAFVEGRLKKSRPRLGRVTVTIQPPKEPVT